MGGGWSHAEGEATNVCLSERAGEDKRERRILARSQSESEESAWLGLVAAVIFFLLLRMVTSWTRPRLISAGFGCAGPSSGDRSPRDGVDAQPRARGQVASQLP